jgi:DNA-binding transcriptional MerR regulator
MNNSIQLPPLDKLYYTIGEVAKMFDINTSNLRYWEKEFKQLAPKKADSGKRKYSQDDVRLIAAIHHLVKERGYTIDGAKKHLSGHKKESVDHVEVIQKLAYVKDELQKILRTMRAE